MRLQELAAGYEAAAGLLRPKLRALRQELKSTQCPQKAAALRHEIAFLSGLLTQCRELAELTARYYERSYYRNEKYTL